jgi:predicted HNH restriction endonuclease
MLTKEQQKVWWKSYYARHKEELAQKAFVRNRARAEFDPDYHNRRNRERKDWAIEYLGGACYKCGGKFPRSVYDFHHKDPSEKEGKPSRILKWTDKEKVKQELDKCLLLCANCHRITHHEE